MEGSGEFTKFNHEERKVYLRGNGEDFEAIQENFEKIERSCSGDNPEASLETSAHNQSNSTSMAGSSKYTFYNRDERSVYLRRTGDDYGDIRDTFEKIDGYTPGANPGGSYSGWVKGQNLYRPGKTAISRNHHLLSLHAWADNPKVKNFDYLYNFKPDVIRPNPEDTEYLAHHHRRRGYLPNSVPFTSSYAGFIPQVDDLEQKRQNARIEGYAKFLRKVDVKRETLIHTYNRVRWAEGNYVDPIPELAERDYTWGYTVPLLRKGEHKYWKPLAEDCMYPDQSKHRGRIDISGYGGHMPNVIGKFGKSIAYHQKQGMQEFKLNYFSHQSVFWAPHQCKPQVQMNNNVDDSHEAEKPDIGKELGMNWVKDCPFTPPRLVMSEHAKEIIKQQKLRPSLQNRMGCSRIPTRREAYDKILLETCPSQFPRNPKFKLPQGSKNYSLI